MKHDYQLNPIAADYMILAYNIVQLSKQTLRNTYELCTQVCMFIINKL